MKTIITLALQSFKELIRKKDFYVVLMLLAGLLGFFFFDSAFGINDISRYLKDIGFSLIMLFSIIISISFCARQIPEELKSKTIYPLLAKPISRAQIILGKYFGSLIVSFTSFTVFFIFYIFLIFSKGEGAPFILLVQTFFCSLMLLSLLCAFSLFLSLFMSVAANITVLLLSYFFVYAYTGILRNMLLIFKGVLFHIYSFLFYIIPHFEFYDLKIRIVHLWDPLPTWAFFSIFTYTIIYVGSLLLLSVLVFRKKNL